MGIQSRMLFLSVMCPSVVLKSFLRAFCNYDVYYKKLAAPWGLPPQAVPHLVLTGPCAA